MIFIQLSIATHSLCIKAYVYSDNVSLPFCMIKKVSKKSRRKKAIPADRFMVIAARFVVRRIIRL